MNALNMDAPDQRMNLLINGRFLTQRTSGVQSFAREICRELIPATGARIIVPAREPLIDDEFSDSIIRTGSLKGHLWEQLNLPLFMSRQRRAVLLNLCNTGPMLATRQIVTVHDLAFLKNPEWFNRTFSIAYAAMIPRLLRTASTVITVSETVKSEIIEQYRTREQKIIVLGNKVPADLLQAPDVAPFDERLVPGRFLLMVGSANPRKNFGYAAQLFRDDGDDTTLVIAGGHARSFNTSAIGDLSGKRIINLDYIDNGRLAWLYRNAAALINPSLYEGFGIPNIEAMAFGCPVLCSDIPVFREVCGEAAFYFNLSDIRTLQNLMPQVTERTDAVKEKIRAGNDVWKAHQEKPRLPLLLNAIRS